MAVLFILIGAVAASAVWFALSRSGDSGAEEHASSDHLVAQLRQCASDGWAHSIAECDAVATNGLVVLDARTAADHSRRGHRQRYAQTLTEHFARPQCSTNPTNTVSLCRTDYLDLAVMIGQSQS